MKNKYTINHFRGDFPDENACLNRLFSIRYGHLKSCPCCCKPTKFVRIKTRRCFKCVKCRHQLFPCAGTIFEKSTTPLLTWFFAIFIFTASKNGISACELQRQVGVTYKTAWRILMQFRRLLKQDDGLLSGIIEADETFVGGKNKNRHRDKKVANSQGRSFKDKTPVLGLIERGGRAFAQVIPDTKAISILPIIFSKVEKGSKIYSDEWDAYLGVTKHYEHQFVYHSRKEYANGDCTTNRIENFWSIFKRTINGSYIHVSRKYMQLYVNEVVFRYNNRNKSNVFSSFLSYLEA